MGNFLTRCSWHAAPVGDGLHSVLAICYPTPRSLSSFVKLSRRKRPATRQNILPRSSVSVQSFPIRVLPGSRPCLQPPLEASSAWFSLNSSPHGPPERPPPCK